MERLAIDVNYGFVSADLTFFCFISSIAASDFVSHGYIRYTFRFHSER